jgi:YidC/Oxa1 family membrane protein insertase
MKQDKDKDKRLLLAVVLSIAVLALYHFFFAPAPKPRPAEDNVAATTQTGESNTPDMAGEATLAAASAPAARGKTVSAATVAKARNIEVRTPLYTARVTTAGGGITSFLLNDFKDVPGPDGRLLNLVGSDALNPPTLSLFKEENRPALPSPLVFWADAPDVIDISESSSGTFLLFWESADGVRIEREYVFHGDRYDFEVRQNITNSSRDGISVRPGLDVTQMFTPELAPDTYTFYGLATFDPQKVIHRFTIKNITKGKVDKGPVLWAAADSKYFAWVVIPEQEWSLTRASILGERSNSVLFTVADSTSILLSGDSVQSHSRVYAGPKQATLLAAVGSGLENLIDYGWFGVLAKPLVFLLKASNRVTGNFGIDIILLTILIKILFLPLSQKSMSSMRKMQELAPIINTLKEKYKGDMNRINQETMNLYKTYKVNPFSGCLPLMAQIPVFIALYKALLVTIDLRHAPFFLWINDLSAPEHLWNIELLGFVLPIRLLPLIMGISMMVQQKLTPAAAADPMQQKLMLMMPVVFTFMFWGFPSGLVLYWLMNNLLTIGHQFVYNRLADAAKAQLAAQAKAPETTDQ